jgi:hypothetical protein
MPVKRWRFSVVGYFEFSAPMFCLVEFQRGSCYFDSAASGSYPQVSHFEG